MVLITYEPTIKAEIRGRVVQNCFWLLTIHKQLSSIMELLFYNSADFDKIPDIASSSDGFHLSLLAMVGQTGNLTDDFKLVTTGPSDLQLTFTGDDFFPHAALHPYRFAISLDPEELVIPVNRIASPWFNLRDLVAAGQVTAIPVQADRDNSFQDDWQQHQKGSNPPGAAIRWIIGVEKDHGMALHL